MIKDLHIITLNIPYPPDYGGMIDSFFRIDELGRFGINIHLHCFEYNRPHQEYLALICKEVNYYRRKTDLLHHLSLKPYIVASRDSETLLQNLTKDDFPILFDGLHTTYFLNHPSLTGRRKIVRLHNIEHRYYDDLAANERNVFKFLFFCIESAKLRRYEKILVHARRLITVSQVDQEYYHSLFGNAELVFPFHPFQNTVSLLGSGNYILYHGDLSVNENAIFAEHLIKKVFSKVNFKCVIAGRKPGKRLMKQVSDYKNINLIADPGNDVMSKLVQESHINIVSSNASTGFKIKLLIALFSGRFCIANSTITKDTGLDKLCYNADNMHEIIALINSTIEKPFTGDMIKEREALRIKIFNNRTSAKRIADMLFTE